MTRKSLVATVVGIAAVAAPSAFADKGGIPHDGSNGQGKPAAQEHGAATAPQGKALAKGHAKTHAKAQAKGHAKTHTTGRALAKGHSKSTTAAPKTTGTPATNTHAKAGKTTICHATGSATNPYVTITISNNAIPAHQRHQDGRDIIPAPAGGCPTQSQQSQTQPGTTQQPSGSTKQQPAAPSAAIPGGPAAATGAQPSPNDKGGVLGTSVSGGSQTSPTSGSSTGSSPARVHVLGASTSGGSSPSASAAPAATATRAASSSKLPFTGTDVIIVAILGLAALLLGVTARRASAIKS